MKSIMHDKHERTCYLCMILHSEYSTQTGLEEHHVIYGRGKRALSEKYGLKVYLCHQHHQNSQESIHNNTAHDNSFNLMLKEKAQQAFENNYPTLSFLEIFGKNYTKKSIKPQCDSNFKSMKGFIELGDVIDESAKGMADL